MAPMASTPQGLGGNPKSCSLNPRPHILNRTTSPQGGIKSPGAVPLICTGALRIPAICCTNQGDWKQRFAPALRAVKTSSSSSSSSSSASSLSPCGSCWCGRAYNLHGDKVPMRAHTNNFFLVPMQVVGVRTLAAKGVRLFFFITPSLESIDKKVYEP